MTLDDKIDFGDLIKQFWTKLRLITANLKRKEHPKHPVQPVLSSYRQYYDSQSFPAKLDVTAMSGLRWTNVSGCASFAMLGFYPVVTGVKSDQFCQIPVPSGAKPLDNTPYPSFVVLDGDLYCRDEEKKEYRPF